MPIQLDPDICCKRMNRVELKHSGMTPRTEWLELGPSSGEEVVPQTISALMLWPPAVPRIMNAVQFGGFGWLLPPSLPPWSFPWFAAFAVEFAPVLLTVSAVAADNPRLLDKIFFFQHNSNKQIKMHQRLLGYIILLLRTNLLTEVKHSITLLSTCGILFIDFE